MAQVKNQPEVKFITSLALAVRDKNDEVQHVQITLCQNVDDAAWRLFFDVVDPNKVPRFQDDELPKADNA